MCSMNLPASDLSRAGVTDVSTPSQLFCGFARRASLYCLSHFSTTALFNSHFLKSGASLGHQGLSKHSVLETTVCLDLPYPSKLCWTLVGSQISCLTLHLCKPVPFLFPSFCFVTMFQGVKLFSKPKKSLASIKVLETLGMASFSLLMLYN